MELTPAVRLYGKRGSPQAYAIRDFLQRSAVPFEWVELANDEQARVELGLESVDDSRLPVCVFPDGTRMERPTVLVSPSIAFGVRRSHLRRWTSRPQRVGLCGLRRPENGPGRPLRRGRTGQYQFLTISRALGADPVRLLKSLMRQL